MTLKKQSWISMEKALWPITYTCIEKVRQHLAIVGQMSATVVCLRDPADIWVYICLSLFVSVLQWIEDAFAEKPVFMISGTNRECTVDGAPRRWHRAAPCGQGISLHTKTISHISLFAGSHQHTRVSFYWNALETNVRGEVSKLSSGTVTGEHSCWFYSVIMIRDQEDSPPPTHPPPASLLR